MQGRLGRAALWTAVGGLVAGLGACVETPPAQVPGAPSPDPAGVPEARAAEPKATGGEKMSCSGKMSCTGMKRDGPKDAPQHPHGNPGG